VSFLERRNSRAKAYIERARGLVAEGQRETEALVHEGVAAYHAGDLAVARTLLSRAVDRGAHADTAQLFLERLHRAETLSATVAPALRPIAAPAATAPPVPTVAWSWTVTAFASVALAAVILVAARPIATLLADLPVGAPQVTVPADALPSVRLSDRVLAQARALREQRRPHQALRLLEGVSVADPARPAADALRADIQRELLAPLEELPPADTSEVRR
jgi:hypothetical protein